MKKKTTFSLCCLLILLLLVPALSLDLVPDRGPEDPNLFQFARIRYNGYAMGGMGRSSRWVPPWMHDYPRAERNFLKILSELTTIQTSAESYNILDLDDPRIMEFPFLYVSEPGYWDLTDKEAANLREFLLRGGFMIFDDFRGSDEWLNLTQAMLRVLPERHFQKLSLEDLVFQCFFNIETLDMVPPYETGSPPEFWGIMDEHGRLQVVANLNNDIGDYWEWSDEAWVPVQLSNEAYRFGINYVIYAITH